MPHIERLITQLDFTTKDDALLLLQEGHFNVAAVHAMLRTGWTVQFGEGTSATYATYSAGGLTLTPSQRLIALEGGSANVTVIAPHFLLFEVRCYPDFGPKAAAGFAAMRADLDQIAHEGSWGFIFGFGDSIYRSFSGEKAERRGRPPMFAEGVREFFPQTREMRFEEPCCFQSEWQGVDLELWTIRRQVAGHCRLLIVGCRSDSPLLDEVD